MKLRQNFLAGLVNAVWSALASLIAIPFFLRYLGIEAYGLIGFFATAQAMIQILDFGLAPTINREVARCSAAGNLNEARTLLHTLAAIYWGMALLIGLSIAVAAPMIAQYWLQSKTLPHETVVHALILMGVIIACRWPIGLYLGTLMGAQRLVVSSAINIAVVTLGNFGAIAVLVFVSPTIETFFAWQAAVGFAYAAVVHRVAWNVLGRSGESERFSFARLKPIWRFSIGMSGVTVSAVLLMQLDKVLLSKVLSLEDFGRYTLAAVLASGLYVLLTPLFNAVYPRMSALVATTSTEKLIDLYRLGTRLFLAVFFPIAIMAAIFAKDLLYIWTGNESLALSAAPIMALFIVGTALNGAMHFPYALQLAYGYARLPLTINTVLILVMLPTTIFLATTYGAIGGALAWAFLNAIYLVLGTWMTHRRLLPGIGAQWLFGDVAVPLSISLVICGGGGKLIQQSGYSYFAKLPAACALGLAAFTLTISMSPRLRSFVRGWRRSYATKMS